MSEQHHAWSAPLGRPDGMPMATPSHWVGQDAAVGTCKHGTSVGYPCKWCEADSEAERALKAINEVVEPKLSECIGCGEPISGRAGLLTSPPLPAPSSSQSLVSRIVTDLCTECYFHVRAFLEHKKTTGKGAF